MELPDIDLRHVPNADFSEE